MPSTKASTAAGSTTSRVADRTESRLVGFGATQNIATPAVISPAAYRPPPSSATDTSMATEVASKKRKAVSKSQPRVSDASGPPAKKVKTAAPEAPAPPKAPRATRAAPAPRAARPAAVINHAPQTRLNVFVFGENSAGELGLGSVGKITDVKRPRLNANLAADTVGVVQVACGGMHAVALTYDNKILTWGVNDQGALGRDTTYEAPMREVNEDEDSEDEDENNGLNPYEATPHEVDLQFVGPGTVFTKVAAGDSMTFALTSTGLVYGCGTFRSNEGILGFSKNTRIQDVLILVENLKNVVDIACGSNHAIALDKNGDCFSFGAGQQGQLGRQIVERHRLLALRPSTFGLPRKHTRKIIAGADHSFAIDDKGQVWAWGLNSYGECGITDTAGEDSAVVLKPEKVKILAQHGITMLAGGAHHSVALTRNHQCLSWGRIDGFQSGHKLDTLTENECIQDERGANKILIQPKALPGFQHVSFAAVGSDQSFIITDNGQVYAWGFSINYQTGLGTTDDIEAPTLIDNTAIRGKHVVWAGAGGQYGMLATEWTVEVAPTSAQVNGVVAGSATAAA